MEKVSWTEHKTHFVLCSVQLTFFILLQVYISKASSLFISSFLMVHVSEPYSTSAVIILIKVL